MTSYDRDGFTVCDDGTVVRIRLRVTDKTIRILNQPYQALSAGYTVISRADRPNLCQALLDRSECVLYFRTYLEEARDRAAARVAQLTNALNTLARS